MEGVENQYELQRQAAIFGNYLCRGAYSESIYKKYVHAVQPSTSVPSGQDKQLFKFAMRHPRLIGFLDAGLLFVEPQAEFRRRLFIMFAILETTPEYSRHFLPRRRSLFYIPVIIMFGVRSVLRAIFGMILVRMIRQ
jgi:hypothetical protein